MFLGSGEGRAAGTLMKVWALTLGMGLAVAVFLEVLARHCLSSQRLAKGFDASPEAARARSSTQAPG